jgi:hypothetical protein
VPAQRRLDELLRDAMRQLGALHEPVIERMRTRASAEVGRRMRASSWRA